MSTPHRHDEYANRNHSHSQYEKTASVAKNLAQLQRLLDMISMGIVSIPAIDAGLSATVRGILRRGMDDTDYQVAPLIIAGTGLVVDSFNVVNLRATDVVIRNTGLAPVQGATLLLIAIHN